MGLVVGSVVPGVGVEDGVAGVEGLDVEGTVGVQGVATEEGVGAEGVGVGEGVDGQDQLKYWSSQVTVQFTK